MSTIDAPRHGPARDAKSQLTDLHFDVRNAIAEVLASPTSTGCGALRRALHRFLSAERTLASIGESVFDQDEIDARRAQLLHDLDLLDAAGDRDRAFRAAETLRSRFLELCHPLWHWRDRSGDGTSES